MGKQQKEIQQTATSRSDQQYNDAQAAKDRMLNSPEMKAYAARTAKRRTAIDTGTFANAADFLSNKDAVAQRKATYDATASLKPTGLGALALNKVNPAAVADQARVRTDEFARDSALQAESDKRGFIGETQAMESDILGKKLGVDSTIMGASFGQSNYNSSLAAQIAAQRASVLPSIIGGALGAAGSMFSFGATGGGGAAGGCWIAEAIYGTDHASTHILRSWLNTEFVETLKGRIVMAFYLTFGQGIAHVTRRSTRLRAFLKQYIFDKALPHAEGAFILRAMAR